MQAGTQVLRTVHVLQLFVVVHSSAVLKMLAGNGCVQCFGQESETRDVSLLQVLLGASVSSVGCAEEELGGASSCLCNLYIPRGQSYGLAYIRQCEQLFCSI